MKKQAYPLFLLSVNRDYTFYKHLAHHFMRQRIKIPQYILKRYAQERNIPENEILAYLKLISFKLERKEKRSLKRFLKEASQLR